MSKGNGKINWICSNGFGINKGLGTIAGVHLRDTFLVHEFYNFVQGSFGIFALSVGSCGFTPVAVYLSLR